MCIAYEKFDFDVEWLTKPFEPNVLCDEGGVPTVVDNNKRDVEGITTSESDSSPPPAPVPPTEADEVAAPPAP